MIDYKKTQKKLNSLQRWFWITLFMSVYSLIAFFYMLIGIGEIDLSFLLLFFANGYFVLDSKITAKEIQRRIKNEEIEG